MHKRIFITGLGIISAIGNNIEESISSLKNKISGISKISQLLTFHQHLPSAEVKISNDTLAGMLGLTENKHKYSRTALLGMIAAREAISPVDLRSGKKLRSGLISATTVGGMCVSEMYYKGLLLDDSYKEFIDTFDCGDAAEKIAGYTGFLDYITTVSTACSSAANAIMLGARLIKNNVVDRVLAGGNDALTRFTVNGFNSLEILDHEPCKPFDEKRKGLTIGEGAAYLLLEPEGIADEKNIICELKGYANANDAFHPTASSPEGYGAYLAMKQTFQMSGVAPSEVGYINAHGTGTDINDLSEGKAIERIFSPSIPPVSSTKAYTGHTLAAAGAVEAVLAALAIKHKMIYPNLHFSSPMKELSFIPVTDLIEDVELKYVLSNSFGFGGNNTSLLFSAY